MKVMKANVLACTKEMSIEGWRAMRKQGIGGSDAASIAGLSPYCSAFAVYMDKLDLCPEKEDNEAMRQGRDLEAYVAERFAERSGKKVKNCNYILQHAEYPWMFANVDRLIVGERAGLECKTTSILNKTDFGIGDVPPNYYVQCQHYMAVTGADKWYLAVLVLNKDFYTFEVPRHEEDIRALIALEKDFWENNVQKKIEPNPDGSVMAGELIKQLYPVGKDDIQVDLTGYAEDVQKYTETSDLIKGLEKEKEQAKQRIQSFMQAATVGTVGGQRVTWRNGVRTALDTKRMQEEQPEVYEQYKIQSNYRMFAVK